MKSLFQVIAMMILGVVLSVSAVGCEGPGNGDQPTAPPQQPGQPPR